MQGTPAAGVYTHTELEEVAYTYTPLNAKHTVEVLLDGGQADAARRPHHLQEHHAGRPPVRRARDLEGDLLRHRQHDGPRSFNITFAGSDILAGTFSDSHGHHGTWDAASGKITFTFSDWEKYKYHRGRSSA